MGEMTGGPVKSLLSTISPSGMLCHCPTYSGGGGAWAWREGELPRGPTTGRLVGRSAAEEADMWPGWGACAEEAGMRPGWGACAVDVVMT